MYTYILKKPKSVVRKAKFVIYWLFCIEKTNICCSKS